MLLSLSTNQHTPPPSTHTCHKSAAPCSSEHRPQAHHFVYPPIALPWPPLLCHQSLSSQAHAAPGNCKHNTHTQYSGRPLNWQDHKKPQVYLLEIWRMWGISGNSKHDTQTTRRRDGLVKRLRREGHERACIRAVYVCLSTCQSNDTFLPRPLCAHLKPCHACSWGS